MRKALPILLPLLLIAAFGVQPGEAQLNVGETAPDFTKQEITSGGPGGFISLYDYTDKDAVILFLLGYG
jgi:hypothetical protein